MKKWQFSEFHESPRWLYYYVNNPKLWYYLLLILSRFTSEWILLFSFICVKSWIKGRRKTECYIKLMAMQCISKTRITVLFFFLLNTWLVRSPVNIKFQLKTQTNLLTAARRALSSSLFTPATLSPADFTAASMSWKASLPSSTPITLSAAIISPDWASLPSSPATSISRGSLCGAADTLGLREMQSLCRISGGFNSPRQNSGLIQKGGYPFFVFLILFRHF